MSQPESPFLTVILAVKDPDAAPFDACIAAIAALRNSHRFDLVIVVSGRLPAISDSVQARLHRIHVVEQEALGVYHAYNRGLDDLRTPYVMVLGCDDLLLPGLDDLIDSIAGQRTPHIVAACALAQGFGIAKPGRFRWGLVFQIWCQQGLLYRSDLFAVRRFDCRYPIHADHRLHLELVSDPATVVEHRDEVICHFSSGGLSSTHYDARFRQDMPGIVRKYYGFFFGIVALAKRALADQIKGPCRLKRVES